MTSSVTPSAAVAVAAVPDRKAGSAAVDGVLPWDLLFEVLLRLPRKPVARLRAVCRSWRALTSDPLFAAAHAARYPDPLIAVGVLPDGGCVDLVDLSGAVVKRIPGVGAGQVLCAGSDLGIFVDGDNHSVSVVDPTTGSVSALPSGAGEDLVRRRPEAHLAWFAFGQAATTGEHKLLRVIAEFENFLEPTDVGSFNNRACEVLSFGAMDGQTWRSKELPPPPIYLSRSQRSGVVLNGAAYFLLDVDFRGHYWREHYFKRGCIPSFDFAAEQWSMALTGPHRSILEEDNGLPSNYCVTSSLSLAELEGRLVAVHCKRSCSTFDLWFLVDFDKCLWSKERRIQVNFGVGGIFEGFPYYDYFEVLRPLFVSQEGKIVIWAVIEEERGVVLMYDPIADTLTDLLEMSDSVGTSVYTSKV